jgi:hypothetical protein
MKIAKSPSPMSGMMKLDTRANDLGDGGMPDLGNPPEGLQGKVRYRALHAGPDRGRMLQVKPGALINPDEMPVSTA